LSENSKMICLSEKSQDFLL